MDDLKPFTGQLDSDASTLKPFSGKLDDGSGTSFKSGDAFHDTKDLIPDLPALWEEFKKEWANRKNTPMTPEVAKKMMQDEHAAGSAVFDAVGALPAMAVGGVAGVGSAIANMDASKGLQTGGKVMNALMPSTLMGHEDDQQREGYKTAMAPFTAIMDTLNAVPQGYGEMLHASGHTDAAGQLTDAGKLAIMATMGVKGAHEAYKAFTAKGKEEGPKLEDPRDDLKPANDLPLDQQNGPTDRGVAPTAENPQGLLFSPEDTPTQPIPETAQMGLFDKPVTIDNGIPYEPLSLDTSGEPLPSSRPADLQMPMVPDRLELVPKDEAPTSTDEFQVPNIGSRDAARAKLKDMAQEELNALKEGRVKDWQTEEAYNQLDRSKNADYAKMEAQKELDFADSADKIQNSTARSFFLDPTNMDKVDFHTDHGFAEEALGDKSLMAPEHSAAMAEHLANGRIDDALDTISQNHDNPAYRNLADYLKGKLDGTRAVVHPEGILDMGDRQATGYYDPTTRTVGFSKVGAVSPHTVLHELVHAMTSDFINMRPNDMRVMGLKDLFNKLNDLGMQKDFPQITHVKEFVAEAHSNPEFQQYLKDHQIQGQNRSTWRRFVDNVKSILGLSSSTRTPITDALEHTMDLSKQVMESKPDNGLQAFKDAGMPSKLADLMVTRQPEKPNAVVKNENMKALTGIAKVGAQWDFTPLKPEEVIPMAREAKDIPASTLETIKANLDAGGRFASLRHSNNPVVKYTFAYVDHAVKQYEKWIRENLTNKDTGLKSKLQNLDRDQFTTVHQQLMLDEGVRERTPQEYRELGWTEPMIDAAVQLRKIGREMIDRINEVRAQLNPPLPPVKYRIGHLAGRFVGDFNHMIYEVQRDSKTGAIKYDTDGTPLKGNAVMRITGSTSWGAQHLADFMQREHPDWIVDKQEYNALRPDHTPDRFSGFTEMLNYVSQHDPAVAKALDSLDKYNRAAATKYLNAMRHAKDKQVQPGGLKGSEGNKLYKESKIPFFAKDPEMMDIYTNAEQGFKGHMAYLDTSAKWVEMQKAMENISKVTGDLGVIKQQPNAIKWSMAYTDHALHRNQGYITKVASSILSDLGKVTGVGHSNITKGINATSTAIMRNWMGIGNIPFALKHMVLPLQKMPAMMTYLKTIPDLNTRMVMSGLKSLNSYYHYLNLPPLLRKGFDKIGMSDVSGMIKDHALTPFEEQAFRYAQDNNVFNVNLDNLSGRIQSGKIRQFLGKAADIDFSGPEHAIRGTSFFFYAHLLHDAGMEAQSALSAAEHMAKALYTDYAPHEAPRAAAKAGWIGQLAFQITRYKANELSQLGFFNRERLTGEDHTFMQKMVSNAPLMVHVGSLLAFTGITGMLAFKEMDEAYSLFRKYLMKSPDNLTALMQRTHVPDLWKYGIFSKIGIDPKIDESALLPSPFPTTTAEIDLMGRARDAAYYNDLFHWKYLALGITPSTLRGPVENAWYTKPITKGENAGKNLYVNPRTGEGRYARTDREVNLRNYGFHSTAETNETDNTYAIKRISNDNRDLAEHVLEKAKGLMASGTLTKEHAQALAQEYAKHQQVGQPDFGSELSAYAQAMNTTQRQQLELKASRDRMGNTLTNLQRNR